MSKTKNRKAMSRVEGLSENSRGKRRMLILTAILTAILMTGGALAQWTSVVSFTQTKPSETGKLSPASFNANAPAKEYIYAGGKLVATEEPQGACTYTLSTTNQSFAANNVSGTVMVTANAGCNWAAVSNTPTWITVTSGSSGSGNGTVNFSLLANSTGGIRNGNITIAGQTFTVFQGIQFNDVPVGAPFYDEIGKLSARGVTLGCGGGNYCPTATVTREQMAAFLLRALGEFNPPTPGSQRFLDVPPSNQFYNFIDRMAVLNITQGCNANNYCPTDPVTREQMAAFLLRAKGEFTPPTPGSQRFNDVPPSNPFYNFIDRMAVLNITQGCQANPPLYCPTNPVTREQMAAFLVRAFNL